MRGNTAYSDSIKPKGKLSDFDRMSAQKKNKNIESSEYVRPLTPPKELFYDEKYDI